MLIPMQGDEPIGDDPNRDQEWALLCTVAQPSEATLIEGRLTAEGIPCVLESRSFSVEPIPVATNFSRIDVHVPDDQLASAREALAGWEQATDPEEADDVP